MTDIQKIYESFCIKHHYFDLELTEKLKNTLLYFKILCETT